MPLSIVGATQASRSGRIITLPVPSGVQNGDLLLVGVHQGSGTETALTPPAGWTKRNFFSLTGGHGLHVYYRVANNEPASYTWRDTVSAVAFCLAIRGQDTTTPFDNADEAPSQTNSSSISTNFFAVNTANALLLAIACQKNGTPTSFTPPPGFTEQADVSVGWAAITCATNSAGAAGRYGPYTFVAATSNNSAGWLTAIRPASSGSTYTRAFTASLTLSSGTGKQGRITKSVALGLVTATAKSTAKGLSAALNLGATLARRTSRILSASLALGTGFSTLRTYLRQFSAALGLNTLINLLKGGSSSGPTATDLKPYIDTIPITPGPNVPNRAFEFRYAYGPVTVGDPSDGSYQKLYSVPYAYYLDRDTNSGKLLRWDGSNWVSVPSTLYPQPPVPVDSIRHIAACFDQSARLVVAYEYNQNVYVYQYDPITSVYVVRGPFPGVDPVLIQDATVFYYPPDSDVLLFHLSVDRKTVLMRAQREQYTTAYTLYTLTTPAYLDQSVALPYQIELLGSLSTLFDKTSLVLCSPTYPVYLFEIAGQSNLTAPTTWDYISIVVVQDLGTEVAGQANMTPPTA